METLTLKAKKREIFGKKVRSLKQQGEIPAVFYGKGEENLSLTLNTSEFMKVWKRVGSTGLVKLFIEDGNKANNVLIHDVSCDPVLSSVKHVDFYQVRLDEKIMTKVPLSFIGISPAVSDNGGILVKTMQEIEVRALPQDLPHEIEVNIATLKTFEDSIFIKDLKISAAVEILGDSESTVASVAPPRSEEELQSLETAPTETVETVKAETDEKKEARAEAQAQTGVEPEVSN